MKQAILITAYQHLEQLRGLIDFFDSDFDFYIHIDRRCKESVPPEVMKSNVYISRRYCVQWGSERHLYAIFHLLRVAYQHRPYSYYHLITTTDYPIKPLSEFKQFFSSDNSISYLEWYTLPRDSWTGAGGLDRVKYYWIGNQWYDKRTHPMRLMYWLLKLQRKIGIDRTSHSGFKQWYGGGSYFSLTEPAVECLVKFDQRRLRSMARFTHCAEEVLPHTILLNSLPHEVISPNSLHLSLWDDRAASPRTLTSIDYTELKESPCFFARKFDMHVSAGLLQRLHDELSIR